MSEIPETRDEIAEALCYIFSGSELAAQPIIMATTFRGQADAIMEWREAWLSAARDAEPRLRPVSEMPEVGDEIATVWRDGLGGTEVWRQDNGFQSEIIGWYLIKRTPKPPSLREMAEALGDDPDTGMWFSENMVEGDIKKWVMRVRGLEALRRAVLEREPQT